MRPGNYAKEHDIQLDSIIVQHGEMGTGTIFKVPDTLIPLLYKKSATLPSHCVSRVCIPVA